MNRKFIIGGVVACACLGVAAPAGAVPVPLTFDHLVLDTPGTGKAEIVTPKTQQVKVLADVNLANGAFTVQPQDFSVPTYSFSSPASGTATVTLAKAASGTINPSTGELTMSADFQANINVNGIGSCLEDTGPLNLSTSTTQPLAGKPFPPGPNGAATGPGAFGAGWSGLTAVSGSGCPTISQVVNGPGGIWVSRGIPPFPPAVVVATKAPKRTKPGKTAKVKVTVKNTGGDDSNPIKACLSSPKPLAPRSSCQTIKTLAGGASKTLTFKVRTNKHKKGHYKLTSKVSGTGIKTVTRKVTLVVR